MAQAECKRCGEGFYYSNTSLSGSTLFFCEEFCPKCRQYRFSELKRVENNISKEFRSSDASKIRCVVCGGKGHLGNNRMECETCDGDGWIRDTFISHKFNYNPPFKSINSLLTDKEGLNEDIVKRLPRDYDKKENCYITTACAMALELPDNCEQLQILRNFRDGFVKKQSSGLEDVAQYYEEAPKVVNAMNLRQDAWKIYQRVYENIRHALSLIQRGDSQGAYNHYKKVCLELKSEFI